MKQWIMIRTALVLSIGAGFPGTSVFASDKAKIVSFVNSQCLATDSESNLSFVECNNPSAVVFSVIPLSSGAFIFETGGKDCLYVEEALPNRKSRAGLANCVDREDQVFELQPLEDFKYSLTAWSGKTCLTTEDGKGAHGAICSTDKEQAFRIRPAD